MNTIAAFTDTAQVGHYIDGQERPGTGGRSQPVYNPATGQQARHVALAGVQEVHAAIAAATRAFPGLGRYPAHPPRARAQPVPRTHEPPS